MRTVVSFVFFFKRKTTYELRISDWSSDVCPSDLSQHRWSLRGRSARICDRPARRWQAADLRAVGRKTGEKNLTQRRKGAKRKRQPRSGIPMYAAARRQIGRASCRERVCQYGSISVVAGPIKKKINTHINNT